MQVGGGEDSGDECSIDKGLRGGRFLFKPVPTFFLKILTTEAGREFNGHFLGHQAILLIAPT